MKIIKFITIIIISLLHGITNAQNTYSKQIKSINYYLDNVPYYLLRNFDYQTPVILPDSIKEKVVSVLNGYIPPQKIKEVTYISDDVLKRIKKRCKEICKNDSMCFIKAKDSIISGITNKALFILNNQLFPESFILAVGAWNVKDAEPVLLKNINNPKYPKEETLLALARLGNDSIKKIIMNKYTLQYVINNTEFKTNNPELIYTGSISDFMYDFFKAGMYLKNKQILLNTVDLLDIQGKVRVSANIINPQKEITVSEKYQPIEMNTIMWLPACFMTKENLQDGTYKELEEITDKFFNQINKNYKSAEIKNTLSFENKTKIKNQIKEWISKNVKFE